MAKAIGHKLYYHSPWFKPWAMINACLATVLTVYNMKKVYSNVFISRGSSENLLGLTFKPSFGISLNVKYNFQ